MRKRIIWNRNACRVQHRRQITKRRSAHNQNIGGGQPFNAGNGRLVDEFFQVWKYFELPKGVLLRPKLGSMSLMRPLNAGSSGSTIVSFSKTSE